MTSTIKTPNAAATAKRRYQKPELRRLGSFHEMTRTVEYSTIVPTQDLMANTYYIS